MTWVLYPMYNFPIGMPRGKTLQSPNILAYVGNSIGLKAGVFGPLWAFRTLLKMENEGVSDERELLGGALPSLWIRGQSLKKGSGGINPVFKDR